MITYIIFQDGYIGVGLEGEKRQFITKDFYEKLRNVHLVASPDRMKYLDKTLEEYFRGE